MLSLRLHRERQGELQRARGSTAGAGDQGAELPKEGTGKEEFQVTRLLSTLPMYAILSTHYPRLPD